MNNMIFHWVNSWATQSAILDKSMILLSSSVSYTAAAIMLMLWFTSGKMNDIENKRTAIYAGCTVALALVLNIIFHLVYYHPRPFAVQHVHKLIPHAKDSSFVSDHALVVFSIAWILWMRSSTWRIPVLCWAALVGISRIFVGVHYPVDVAGSALLAYACGYLILHFSAKLEPFVQFVMNLSRKVKFFQDKELERKEKL
ncbi:undecaprenyl-diphosphatase [Fictibacillus enclensis]|uniref:Phosphoesterase n=1 Tax=Fictibacillus enclensis TaxID=1017270 RepID=A0A0V8JFL4_9BACL|nr:undecaprenyl-diphosphatase [Fictibacillus enclensis]KSU85858.1 phosphoesterase [Fictibacillus enclensis]SCC03966.1 undecaprenyl-diphosphatase [Fictibacillus enclensis]